MGTREQLTPELKALKERTARAFARDAAICIDMGQTPDGMPALMLSGALASGERKYDWAGKIMLQLTEGEVAGMLAVVYGYIPRFAAKGHGTGNEKKFRIEDQGSKLYVCIEAAGEKPRAVPITPTSSVTFGRVLLLFLLEQAQWPDTASLLAHIKNSLGRMVNNAIAEQQKKEGK